MIFLLLDIILSYFTLKPTYFFLLNLVIISTNKYFKLLIITLVLDLLILNTYFINTIIIFIIFFLYKKLSIIKPNFLNYILSLTIIYFIYIILIGLVNHYDIVYLVSYGFNNYFRNFIFYIICYKLVFKRIKLSR